MSASPIGLPIAHRTRPWLLTVVPLWFRERLARRLYLNRVDRYAHLFSDAELLFAPGIKLDLLPTDVGHAMIALTGMYEFEVTRRLAPLAVSGGLLVDVGANYGYYTCLWLGLNPSNRAVAVEASPRNLGPLASNIARNGLNARARVVPFAAGREDADVRFTLGGTGQSGWGGITAGRHEDDLILRCKRLDTIAAELGWTDVEVLKIDVEGADPWVLEGAEGLLRAHRIRHVFFEENPARARALGIPGNAAQSLLTGFGYGLEQVTPTEWYAFVPRVERRRNVA